MYIGYGGDSLPSGSQKREATEYPILLRDWLYWLVSFHLPETDILKP